MPRPTYACPPADTVRQRTYPRPRLDPRNWTPFFILARDFGAGRFDFVCLIKHYMCVKQHIFSVLASQRRRLGLSQQELAARAGLRREKVNRIESKAEDVSVEELSRLLDAVGLALVVQEKSAAPFAHAAHAARQLVPREFDKAAFIDGAKVKILDWGKVPM